MGEKIFTFKVSFEETSARLSRLARRFLFAGPTVKPKTSPVGKQVSQSRNSKTSQIPKSTKSKLFSKVMPSGIHSMYLSYGPEANVGMYIPVKLPDLYVVTNRRNEPILLTSRHNFPGEKPRRVLFVFYQKADLVDFFYKAFRVINRGDISKAKYPLRCEKIPSLNFGSWFAKNSGQYQIVLAGSPPYSGQYRDLIIDSVKNICPKADILFDINIDDYLFFKQSNFGGPKIFTPPEDFGLDPYFFDRLDLSPPFSKKVLNDIDSGRFYRRILGTQKALEIAEKNKDITMAYMCKSKLSRDQEILAKKLVFDAEKSKNLNFSFSNLNRNLSMPDVVGFYIYFDGNLSKVDPAFLRLEDLLQYMQKNPKRFTKDVNLMIQVCRFPGKKVEFLIKNNLIVL